MIISIAARHSLPLIGTDQFPKSGGLMSYTWDSVDLHAQAASYIDRILKGANPADLPVQQPTRFSLVINLRTAKALGLVVPARILQLADEVLEYRILLPVACRSDPRHPHEQALASIEALR